MTTIYLSTFETILPEWASTLLPDLYSQYNNIHHYSFINMQVSLGSKEHENTAGKDY